MIKGIGVDIVKIGRIERLLLRYGNIFTSKVFTPSEVTYCRSRPFPAVHFAGRWAAKEAFYKALPSQCQRLSHWKSIEICHDDIKSLDKPTIKICAETLKEALQACGISGIHLSISHEKEMCIAAVVLE